MYKMLRRVPGPLQVFNKFYLVLYYYCCYSDQLARLLASKTPRHTIRVTIHTVVTQLQKGCSLDPNTGAEIK